MVTLAPDTRFNTDTFPTASLNSASLASLSRLPSAESDTLLARRVRQTLAELHVPILRTLDVSAVDGVVALRGRVRSYYERQLAHANVRRIAGVEKLIEEITVADPQAAIPLAKPPRFRVA
jgi:osmotically-inducible protein OsmY